MKAIATKMARAAKIVGYGVPKDGENKSQGYAFTSASNVKMRCGPALSSLDVAVSSRVEVLKIEDVPTKSGGQQQRVMVKVALTFVDGETGESITSEGPGSGMDSGDKAIMKAYTAAEKYAYVAAFCIALGEDPEYEEDEETRRAQAQRQQPRGVPDQRSQTQTRAPSQQTRTETRTQEPKREGAAGLWDHLKLAEDETTIKAWFVKNLPAIRGWSDANKGEAWKRIVQHGAAMRVSEGRLLALRAEVIKQLERAAA